MNSLPIYVYVDVDDTFVRSASSKRIPMPAAIRHIRGLKEQGAVLYCWSSGGPDYARQSAEEFGIADCFEAFLPKPNVLLDDMTMTTWPRFITVHPGSCDTQTLEHYRRLLT
jgi:hypothetical protein